MLVLDLARSDFLCRSNVSHELSDRLNLEIDMSTEECTVLGGMKWGAVRMLEPVVYMSTSYSSTIAQLLESSTLRG